MINMIGKKELDLIVDIITTVVETHSRTLLEIQQHIRFYN